MAEQKRDDGTLRPSGMYHKYTQEFIDIRNQYEVWRPGAETNQRGSWEKKKNISDADYAAYVAKYYQPVEYTRAVRIKGEATGQIIEDRQDMMVPKAEYRQILETTLDGRNMRNAKYDAIMRGTDAKSVAQREFYQLYIDMYENDLLKKIPIGQSAQMLGRVPLVQNRLMSDVKEQGNFVYQAIC